MNKMNSKPIGYKSYFKNNEYHTIIKYEISYLRHILTQRKKYKEGEICDLRTKIIHINDTTLNVHRIIRNDRIDKVAFVDHPPLIVGSFNMQKI